MAGMSQAAHRLRVPDSVAVRGQSQTYSVKVPMPGETFVVPVSRIRRFLEDADLGDEARWRGKVGNPTE